MRSVIIDRTDRISSVWNDTNQSNFVLVVEITDVDFWINRHVTGPYRCALDAAFSVRSVGQTNVCHVLSRGPGGEWAMDVEEHDDSRPARNTTAVQSTSYYAVTEHPRPVQLLCLDMCMTYC